MFEFAVNLHIYKAVFFLGSSFGLRINDISPGLVEGPAPIGVTIANLDNRSRRFIEESGLASLGHLRAIANMTSLNTPFLMPQLDLRAQLAVGIALYEAASYGVIRSLLNDRENLTVPPYTFTVGNFTNLTA
ncbi:desiccation-related protein PCC13-62-like [Hibiscus syriacus]|uniref:desiccation-related protein PCC13-62-like n=1 Tax=Hibiscus syriacus TaxID=106335 RepID=UPI00192193E3|nr:desiccation-related protein PCC13-62-like [Hibiscus syriacus]